jgi:predicted MPP superfamily phosphohydrolase
MHRALVGLVVLERLPTWLALALLAGVALVVGRLWNGPTGLVIAGAHFAIGLADWLALWLLPRLGRSFGPVMPPLLALTLARAALTLGIGWTVPSIGLAVGLQLTLTALSLYATWIEPFRLQLTHQALTSPRLDLARPPVHLLHLADLHVERVTERERHVQRLIDQVQPDLILFSGDFVSLSHPDDPATRHDIRCLVSGWRAPFGMYVVSGSPLIETQSMVAGFVEGTGAIWLRDEVRVLDVRGQPIALVGLTCHHRQDVDGPRLRRLAGDLPPDALRVLLYHSPDLAQQAAELGFDLYLCGHTHGGQIRLPLIGALLTSSDYGKRFEMGRHRVGPLTLYVSRGIGMEGGSAPRARLLCPPEVTVWTLQGEEAPA